MTDQPGPGDNGGAYQSGVLVWRNGVPDPAQVEALRVRLGDEIVDRMLRASELMRNPRPLTGEERTVLDAVMDPVLADLRAVGAILPEVRYEAWEDRGPDYVCAFIAPPGQTLGGNGVWVARFGPAGERVAELAEQVQEWEVEALAAAGRPATWPECPEHPRSHPLEPIAESAKRAVWRCPRSHRAVAGIGELGGSGGRIY
ncbi:MAG TPA: hypothetical protein VMI73_14995 [Trebonia sp.]|nr:hypothetical protein [Trebonia sp.]